MTSASGIRLTLDLSDQTEFALSVNKPADCSVCKVASQTTLSGKDFVICADCVAVHDPTANCAKIFGETKQVDQKKAKELIYNQSTGELSGGRLDKSRFACSGNSEKGGRRKGCYGGYHSKQYVSSTGPIPCGLYSIKQWQQTKNTTPENFRGLGCYTLRPVNKEILRGRSGFLIHPGQVTANPSEGCICLSDEEFKSLRGQVEETLLRVISGGGDAVHDKLSPVAGASATPVTAPKVETKVPESKGPTKPAPKAPTKAGNAPQPPQRIQLSLDLYDQTEFAPANKKESCSVCKVASLQTLKCKDFLICSSCATIHDPKADLSKIFPKLPEEKKTRELIYNHSTGQLSGGRLDKPRTAFSGNSDKGGRRKGCFGGYHSKQYVSSVGPIPCGLYSIKQWQQTKNTTPENFRGLGCYFLRPVNPIILRGRGGFLIHPGDVMANPSEGCICLSDEDFKSLKGQVEETLLRVVSGGGDAAHDLLQPLKDIPSSGAASKRMSQAELDLMRKNADKGDAKAQFELGVRYNKGNGLDQDAKSAFEWVSRAAEQKFPDAINQLGQFYETGTAVPKSIDRAVELYRQAADMGLPDAKVNLGLCYQNGNGVEKDQKKAVELYRSAIDQDYPRAKFRLGVCLEMGFGIEKDGKAGVEWYRKAGEQGEPGAQYNLAMCYQSGDGGLGVDAKQAATWFQRAAEQGHPQAQTMLAIALQKGAGLPANPALAADWLRRAAEQGATNAQCYLALCYANGRGVELDERKAFEWFCKAKAGNVGATAAAAGCYEFGFGTPRNEMLAITARQKVSNVRPFDFELQLRPQPLTGLNSGRWRSQFLFDDSISRAIPVWNAAPVYRFPADRECHLFAVPDSPYAQDAAAANEEATTEKSPPASPKKSVVTAPEQKSPVSQGSSVKLAVGDSKSDEKKGDEAGGVAGAKEESKLGWLRPIASIEPGVGRILGAQFHDGLAVVVGLEGILVVRVKSEYRRLFVRNPRPDAVTWLNEEPQPQVPGMGSVLPVFSADCLLAFVGGNQLARFDYRPRARLRWLAADLPQTLSEYHDPRVTALAADASLNIALVCYKLWTQVQAFDLSTGHFKWKVEALGNGTPLGFFHYDADTSLVITAPMCASPDGTFVVQATSATMGAPEWRSELKFGNSRDFGYAAASICDLPAIACQFTRDYNDEPLLIIAGHGRVIALNCTGDNPGKVRYEKVLRESKMAIDCEVACSKGELAFISLGCLDGTLVHAIRVSDGSPVWNIRRDALETVELGLPEPVEESGACVLAWKPRPVVQFPSLHKHDIVLSTAEPGTPWACALCKAANLPQAFRCFSCNLNYCVNCIGNLIGKAFPFIAQGEERKSIVISADPEEKKANMLLPLTAIHSTTDGKQISELPYLHDVTAEHDLCSAAPLLASSHAYRQLFTMKAQPLANVDLPSASFGLVVAGHYLYSLGGSRGSDAVSAERVVHISKPSVKKGEKPPAEPTREWSKFLSVAKSEKLDLIDLVVDAEGEAVYACTRIQLICLSLDGNVRWNRPNSFIRGNLGVAPKAGVVFMAANVAAGIASKVEFLSIEDGKSKWAAPPPAKPRIVGVFSGVSQNCAVFYSNSEFAEAGFFTAKFYVCDLQTGQTKWEQLFATHLRCIRLAQSVILALDTNNVLRAVSIESGAERWTASEAQLPAQIDIRGRYQSAIYCLEDRKLVVAQTSEAVVYRLETGERVTALRHPGGEPWEHSALVHGRDGALLAATAGSIVSLYDMKDFSLLFDWDCGCTPSSVALAPISRPMYGILQRFLWGSEPMTVAVGSVTGETKSLDVALRRGPVEVVVAHQLGGREDDTGAAVAHYMPVVMALVALATVVIEFLQMLAFAFTLASPASLGNTAAAFHQITVFGLQVNSYIVNLIIVLLLVLVFAICFLISPPVENRTFVRPHVGKWKYAWLFISIFTKTAASAGFLPILSTLLKAFQCTTIAGVSVMTADPNNACSSGAAQAYMALAGIALCIYMPISFRLLRVAGDLNSIELRIWRPWDWSGDQLNNPPYGHLLSPKEPAVDLWTLAIKVLLTLFSVFLAGNVGAQVAALLISGIGFVALDYYYVIYFAPAANQLMRTFHATLLWSYVCGCIGELYNDPSHTRDVVLSVFFLGALIILALGLGNLFFGPCIRRRGWDKRCKACVTSCRRSSPVPLNGAGAAATGDAVPDSPPASPRSSTMTIKTSSIAIEIKDAKTVAEEKTAAESPDLPFKTMHSWQWLAEQDEETWRVINKKFGFEQPPLFRSYRALRRRPLRVPDDVKAA